MAGSTFGNLFCVTTWGESHGRGIGVVVDGCPAGLPLDEQTVQQYLNRRKPGQTKYSTPRKEDDLVEIQSGVFEGKTTGTPISMVVYNKTQRSSDYSEIASYYRPGHADYTFDQNMDFEIIAVVAAPPVGRRLDVLPEALWHWKCFGHWELRFMRTVRRLPVL